MARTPGALLPVAEAGADQEDGRVEKRLCVAPPDPGQGPPASDKVRAAKEGGLQLSATTATPHTQAREGWRWDRGQRSSPKVTGT